MDASQFDSIAKRFAERRSRRGAVKMPLGGALDGAAAAVGLHVSQASVWVQALPPSQGTPGLMERPRRPVGRQAAA